LVIECATMSNPSSSGRWKNGVAKVLSQTEITPRLRQICASAARSQIFSIGLVGVSTQSSFVFGRNAASTARASATSTYVCSMPRRLKTLSARRNVPPYTSSLSTT